MRSPTSKQGDVNNRGISGHMFTLHQRLHHALSLGVGCWPDQGRKWQFGDIETQKLVLRAIDAFLCCISSETLRHPLVRDSIVDMVGALGSILELKCQSTLRLALNVTVKMVSMLPSSMLEPQLATLLCPLIHLLPTQEHIIGVLSATALNAMISSLSIKVEKEVWDIVKRTDVVSLLVHNIRDSCIITAELDYICEMTSLLGKILWRWPPSRYHVWSDTIFLQTLPTLNLNHGSSVKVVVLQLYSSLALCASGAIKLLENGESIIHMTLQCMNQSNSCSLRKEAFRLARCLMTSKEGCLKVIAMSDDRIVKAIISGMSNKHWHSGKNAKDEFSIAEEACRLTLITRWAGNHHKHFWKEGVDRVLLNLILDNLNKEVQTLESPSLKEQIAIVDEGFHSDIFSPLRPYVWDCLGWLASHCQENFGPETQGDLRHLNILLICACLAFRDSTRAARRICQDSVSNAIGSESASRAVLMMVYSPSKYIASKTKSILSELLAPEWKTYVDYSMNTVTLATCGRDFGSPSNLQLTISLMSLACCSSIQKWRKYILKREGAKVMINFIRRRLQNPVRILRLHVSPHLHYFYEKTCCQSSIHDWEGEDMMLLFGLWSLAELMHHCGSSNSPVEMFGNGQGSSEEAQFVEELKDICINSSSHGSKWYAAYILCFFGVYGFPSKGGERMRKAFREKENADIQLILSNQETVLVHGIMLITRCPSLLPPSRLPLQGKCSSDSSTGQSAETHNNLLSSIQLSSQVDYHSLVKLSEYIYSGHLQAGEDLVRKLKLLAKRCDLQTLLLLLHKKIPEWGTPVPSFDLSSGLGPIGHHFSDIVLEADTCSLLQWACNFCSAPVPHMHVHKVILRSSCEYFQALFRSGMQESQVETIKVPVSWNSLCKLVSWFYSDELPKPTSGCLWDNLDIKEKLHEVRQYVELCWLGEFWLLEDFHKECFGIVLSCLNNSCHGLFMKVIQVAASFFQWDLVEVAANHLGPFYRHLRNSGELDELDDALVEMVRCASVRFSQQQTDHSA